MQLIDRDAQLTMKRAVRMAAMYLANPGQPGRDIAVPSPAEPIRTTLPGACT